MRTLLVLTLALTVIIGGSAILALWHFDRNLPDYQKLVDYRPPSGRTIVPLAAIPTPVVHAFLAAEDANFYSHPGIDVPMVLRAAVVNVFRYASNERLIGASTITQQLVKNTLLRGKASFKRKIKEALLALRIERLLSKDRILELYLDEMYLGCGAHGVTEAALNYFHKSLETLTIEEAAFLAALPKAPSHYNPLRFPRAAKARRDWVLDRMVEDGYLSPSDAIAAKAALIQLGANSCNGDRANRPEPVPTAVGPER